MPLHSALVHAWSPSISFDTDPGVADLVGEANLTPDVGFPARIIDTESKGRYSWDLQNNNVGLSTALVPNSLWDGSSAKFSISFWAKRDQLTLADTYLECFDGTAGTGCII